MKDMSVPTAFCERLLIAQAKRTHKYQTHEEMEAFRTLVKWMRDDGVDVKGSIRGNTVSHIIIGDKDISDRIKGDAES